MSRDEKARRQYDARYARESYYWSTSPSAACLEILKAPAADRAPHGARHRMRRRTQRRLHGAQRV